MKNNKKNNVSVKAKQVIVNQTKNKTKNKRNRRSGAGPSIGHPPPGIQSGLAGLTPAESKHITMLERLGDYDTTGFSEQSVEFIHNYIDPCGEHNRSIDSVRVPDGALDTSMGGFFRTADTISFPWHEQGISNLGENTYSMLWLTPPLFRTMAIILAKEKDGEFSQQDISSFCVKFANIPSRSTVLYPNWHEIESGFYFTVIDTQVMRTILPPNQNGVSETLQKYRCTGYGLEVLFNTPDLLNQATFTCMRYPTDQSVKSFEVDSPLSAAEPFYLATSIIYSAPSNTVSINVGPNNVEELPVFSGSITSLPSPPVTSTVQFRNNAATFTVSVGHSIQYVNQGGAIQLRNVTLNTFISLKAINPTPFNNSSASNVTRFYFTGGNLIEGDHEADQTFVTIPPVTQADMAQQDVKSMITLAKEVGGVYVVGRIFQPIFNVTSAASYRKVILTTADVEVLDVISPKFGWFDTVDQNFSFQAVNWQSVPYACKPMIKIVRTNEIVPAPQSILGIAATGCPPEQPEAIEIAKAFSTNQPHGYPVSYNGLGILFAKVLAVTEKIPDMLRSSNNIYREVKRICDQEVAAESSTDQQADVLKGFKRLMARY